MKRLGAVLGVIFALYGFAYARGFMMGLNGGGAPAVNCGTGTIDLSTGCVQPMLGVM